MFDAGCRRFEGKSVLVTGGGRGIGRVICISFAREGADVALNDIRQEELQKTRDEIASTGRTPLVYKVDVTVKQDVVKMVEDIVGKFGKIDILINNAGIAFPTPFLKITEEEWDKLLAVNLKGAVLVTQAVLPSMIKSKYGKIVMISSLSGKTGGAGLRGGVATGAHYSVSKAGIMVLARQLAREFGSYGINVNSVSPSFAETDLLKDIAIDSPERREAVVKLGVIQRLATPEDIANAVLFLASDSSSFITGETINISGGRLMD